MSRSLSSKLSRIRLTAMGLLLAVAALSTGCQWFWPAEPRKPADVSEWMRQPRPGGEFGQ